MIVLLVLMFTTAGITCCARLANDGISTSIWDSSRAGIVTAKINAPMAPPEINKRQAYNAFSYLSIVPANQIAASVTMLASSTMIRLKPSTPVVKLNRHSGDMGNEVTCWKLRWL